MRIGSADALQSQASLVNADIRAGIPAPYGATQLGEGVNFALFSRNATRVFLDLYQNPSDSSPQRVIELDPVHHRTGDVWHVWVRGIPLGQPYAYRMDGPYQPEQGHRFNVHKSLLDPFAVALAGVPDWDFVAARGYDSSSSQTDLSFSTADNAGTTPKCVVLSPYFDWEDVPPRLPESDVVIYETHVRGFTIDPSANVRCPGTFRGLTEKIPYLRDLGITAIELMPVQEFNQDELIVTNPVTAERLRNFWGYNPAANFAPKESYAMPGALGRQVSEFREMVKAFHRAGVEVILDIVLNHTAEGNELGPTLCFRGIDNSILYLLDDNRRYYKNYSGVGNTLNANHPVVRDFVMDVLRYWVTFMHVDGFRFDLASVLGRDEHGNLLQNAPLLESIAEDPILRDVKIIAEAWDAGGAYQVGSFSERRWAEWNGRFRDDVRRFWLGDDGMMGLFASRICGSADLYAKSGKGPESTINFVTSHDGFTLNDLVCYKQKHNWQNGESNRDGADANYSDNCGVEGRSADPHVNSLRNRLIKNFLLTLFVSRGVPMLLGGDEFRRTQQGNNNAYCQDNAVTWFDWTCLETNQEIHRFTRSVIAFRRAHPVLSKEKFYAVPDITWLGPRGDEPNWLDPAQKSFACVIFGESEPDLLLMFNAAFEPMDFSIPSPRTSRTWRLAVDTSQPAPEDIYEPGAGPSMKDRQSFHLNARSAVILVGD